MNGNLRTNDANGKRRPSGNGHISRSSSGRNFGFLRYLISYSYVNVPISNFKLLENDNNVPSIPVNMI